MDLLSKLDDIDTKGGIEIPLLLKAFGKLRREIYAMDDNNEAMKALDAAWDLLGDDVREQNLWRLIFEVTEVMRKNSDTHKKWANSNDNSVSMAEVIEVFIYFQQLAFVFIPNPADRKEYVNRARDVFPKRKIIGEQLLEASFKE